MKDTPDDLREEEWEEFIASVLEENGIMVTNSTGLIIWVNKAFTRLTGYSNKEVTGRNPNILKSGYHDSKFYKDLWDTITSGEVWSGIMTNRRKDGSRYRELMSITPLKTKEGSITYYVALKKDMKDPHNWEEMEIQQNKALESVVPLMTKLNEVTTALEQARIRTHAMLNAIGEAIMLLSPDGKMLWINQAFGKFFSIVTQDATGDSFQSLKSHWERVFEDPLKIMHFLNSAKENRLSEEREAVTQIWPRKRKLEVYSAPVKDASNEYLGQLFVFRDVTHEREVERMKSEFVSLASHEFRTPLTSILGYTEMMLEGDTGELTDGQTDFLKIIQRNATNLTRIVNDFLIVSQLEEGAIKLNLGLLDIHEIVKNAVELLQPQIDAKKMKLDVSVPQDLPKVEGDSQRILQAIINLLSNANNYTPSGGRISIVVKVKDDFLTIGVKDTGIGISVDDQKRLFTRFFRSKNPETIKSGGTGLGLWITHSIIEMHCGEILVISELGKGSTFTIKLPIKQE